MSNNEVGFLLADKSTKTNKQASSLNLRYFDPVAKKNFLHYYYVMHYKSLQIIFQEMKKMKMCDF